MKARIMGGTLLLFSRETPWARGCLPITPCVPCGTCFMAFTFKYQAPNEYCSVFCQNVDPFELEDIEVLDTYMNGRRLNITDKVVPVPHKKPQ